MTDWKSWVRARIEHRHFISGVLLGGLILRLVWIIAVQHPQVSDFKWYLDSALSIASGNGYSVENHPTAYYPVGYPGFLSLIFYLFGPSIFVAKLVNIVLSLGTAVLAYLISKEIFGSEVSARIALFLMCFFPSQIAYCSLLGSEIFHMFLMFLAAYVFMRVVRSSDSIVLAGLIWGVATLTKPQSIFVPLIFLLFYFRSTKTLLRATIVIYVAIFACVFPWMVRNRYVMGKMLFSTNAGIVLMQSNNDYANGKHLWDENINGLLGDLRGPAEGFDTKEVAREARARQIGLDYITHHPVRTISLWPKKFYYLYKSDIDGFYYSMGMRPDLLKFHTIYFALRVLAQFYYLVAVGLAICSLRIVIKSKMWSFWLGVYIVGYFTCVYLIAHGDPRYHFVEIPWLAIYAGLGATWLLNSWPPVEEKPLILPFAT